MNRRRTILVAMLVTVLAAAALLLASGAGQWLRVIVGIPFVLLLPGQAIMLLVDFDGRVGGFEGFALSVAASVAVTALTAMGLASTPAGLTADSAIIALAAEALLALLFALLQTPPELMTIRVPAQLNPVKRAGVGALALLGFTLAVLVMSFPLNPAQRGGGVVQLWALPDGAGGLRIGAVNVDAASRRYRLSIDQAGQQISQEEIDIPAGSSRIFDVKNSATFTQGAPVEAQLTDTSGVIAPRTISVWTTQ